MASYPAVRYQPLRAVDLASRTERARLTRSALKAYDNIVACWGLENEDARKIFGGVSDRPRPRILNVDAMRRISYLIGIFRALNTIFDRPLADQWVRLPNSNRIFKGSSPLAYMKHGGTPAMQTVRRLLDARVQGM